MVDGIHRHTAHPRIPASQRSFPAFPIESTRARNCPLADGRHLARTIRISGWSASAKRDVVASFATTWMPVPAERASWPPRPIHKAQVGVANAAAALRENTALDVTSCA